MDDVKNNKISHISNKELTNILQQHELDSLLLKKMNSTLTLNIRSLTVNK